MQQKETMAGILERVVRGVRAGLLASVAVTPRREEALAYVRVSDEEELIDAERQAAIIRERMRRHGLFR